MSVFSHASHEQDDQDDCGMLIMKNHELSLANSCMHWGDE
jgi:hypothetical protein